jgi:MFS family permease
VSTAFVPGERPRPDWLRQHPRAWVAAVATVSFGAFLGQLDASIVTLTYRPIGRQFGTGLAAVQWVSLAYLVALGALLVPIGRVSDRLGRKRVYLWGFGLFTAASFGCAVAPSLAVLIAVRVAQGAGAAMLQANSVALVTTSAPRPRLRAALGMQAAAQATGLAIGPTVGGLIVQSLGWRWVFALNVPIGLVALGLGRFLLPRTRLGPDGSAHGLRAVFTARGALRGLGGALLAYLLLFGPIVLVPALVLAHGTSPLHAGLLVAALPVGFALAAALADRVLPRAWTSRPRCLLGLALAVVGLVALLFAGVHPVGLALGLAALGIGLGLFTPANNARIMSGVPSRVAALTGGLVSAARAAGTAAGVAIVSTTLPIASGGRLTVVILIALAGLAAALSMAGDCPVA